MISPARGIFLEAFHSDGMGMLSRIIETTAAVTDMGERQSDLMRRSEHATPDRLAVGAPSPTIVLPDAPPAVLVDLHTDRRLCLSALQRSAGCDLAEFYSVAQLMPGSATLRPAGLGRFTLEPLRVDPRSRIRLTEGVALRLGVRCGGQVLVVVRPTGDLALFNLALVDLAVTATADGVALHGAQLAMPSTATTDAALTGGLAHRTHSSNNEMRT